MPIAFHHIFSDYTLQVVLLGSVTLGIAAGSLGAFAVLRKQSLLGDAVSHATLPGVCLAFMLTLTRNIFYLIIGAAASGWIGTLLVKLIIEQTRIKKDAALGIVLSVFFGIGLMLLTVVQRMPQAVKAGLDKFLFGNAATLLIGDVQVMIALSLACFFCLLLFWKQFKLIVFDPDFALSLGLRVHALDIFLTSLIVMAIVIGLQAVGVVLMSAMLVAPAAAARQWTDRLGVMVMLSSFFGALGGACGSLTSSLIDHMPTGPAIVVYLSVFVFVSLFFAPCHGLLWNYLRQRRNRKNIRASTVMRGFLALAGNHDNPFHPHQLEALSAIGGAGDVLLIKGLERQGLLEHRPGKGWALTEKGLEQAGEYARQYEQGFDERASH